MPSLQSPETLCSQGPAHFSLVLWLESQGFSVRAVHVAGSAYTAKWREDGGEKHRGPHPFGFILPLVREEDTPLRARGLPGRPAAAASSED